MTYLPHTMKNYPGATRAARGEAPLLEMFWGKGDEAKALFRECQEIVARRFGSIAIASTKPAEPARRPRKPTLTSVAKQASQAGIEVARYEVKPDGSVVVVTGAPAPLEANPWDEIPIDAADQKRPS